MRVTRSAGRVPGVIVAVLLTAALVGGCGAGSSKPDLAAQDKLVELSNRLAAVHAQYAAAQRRLVLARRAVARVRVATPVKRAAPRTIVRVTGRVEPSLDFSLGTLCAAGNAGRLEGARRRAMRAALLRRRRALNYLNLSCPAA